MKRHAYRITALDAGSISIDGGQLFGLLPKQEWRRIVRADQENRVTLPARVLLVETPACTVLFDTGPGLFPSGPNADLSLNSAACPPLASALTARGIAPEQISHIFLSHLHDNTAGGLLTGPASGAPLLFSKAKIYTNKKAVRRACSPHLIDESLFLSGTGPLLEGSPMLEFISDGQRVELDGISVSCTETCGHSPGMMIFRITRGHCHVIAGADLLPGMAWTDVLLCSNLERHPEQLAEEKQKYLTRAAEKDAWIFYPHDPNYGFSKIRMNDQTGSFVPTHWGNTLAF